MKIMQILILAITALLVSACGNSQENEKYFINKNTPEAVHVIPEKINKLISDIKDDKIKNIHSLLIIKDNTLIT